MKAPLGYQTSDAHIVDYELYELPGVGGAFRGPPIQGSEYVACVGAAQTFGRFVQAPFPTLISRALAIEALNLGRGGAGPDFYLDNPRLMASINGAQVVIVQVFSGRSQSNSLFSTIGQRTRGINRTDGRELSADQFYTWLLSQDRGLAQQILAETRENYLSAMTRLLDAIQPPKALLWFSVRRPEYQERWELPLARLWGAFPHFVNREMVNELRNHADVYVECVSQRGLPQPILDRSGSPASVQDLSLLTSEIVVKTENRYYPSPEMHEEVAALLLTPCRKMLKR
ncbi:MAG: DUF6473 family protein [Bryobacteraceae bacterium]|jgi:hypothetical protein